MASGIEKNLGKGKKIPPKKKQSKKDKAKAKNKELEEEVLDEEVNENTEELEEEQPEEELDAEATDEEMAEEEPAKGMSEDDDPLASLFGGAGGSAPQSEEPAGPLEAIDQAGSEIKQPKENGSKKLDGDTLAGMMMTGDNSEGMFEPDIDTITDENDVVHEEVDDKAKVKSSGKVTEKGDKYIELFAQGMRDNPNDFQIDTPKGKMSIRKAIAMGYNPITRKFDQKGIHQTMQEHLSQLNEADQEGIAGLLNPNRAQVAPADASKYGLEPDNPMVRQDAVPMPGADAMMQQGMPQGMPMPQGGMPIGGGMDMPQSGGADILAALGGK